jgi:hypothetical protein
MNIHMRHVVVLGLPLALVRLLNREIEPVRVRIARQNALKLLFMELHQFLDRFPE